MSKKIEREPTITKEKFKALLDADHPRHVVWDIETGPIPREELRDFMDMKKVSYPKKPVPVDPSKVKYGNLGQDKRAEKLTRLNREYQQAVASYHTDCGQAEEDYLDELYDKAALRATTNIVLAIGYGILMSDGSISTFLDTGTEKELCERMWYMVDRVMATGGNFYTWNGDRFDIPVMTAKAWKYDLHVPYLLTKYSKMEDCSIDAAKRMAMGNYQSYTKLDHAAKFLGVAGKTAGVTGDMFHKMFNGGKREAALSYLWHDIDCTYRVCAKMGLLDKPFRILRSAASQTTKGKK